MPPAKNSQPHQPSFLARNIFGYFHPPTLHPCSSTTFLVYDLAPLLTELSLVLGSTLKSGSCWISATPHERVKQFAERRENEWLD